MDVKIMKLWPLWFGGIDNALEKVKYEVWKERKRKQISNFLFSILLLCGYMCLLKKYMMLLGFFPSWCIILLHLMVFAYTHTNKKIEIRDRATNQIIKNINKTVDKLNTTKQRPIQGNGMAAISKSCILTQNEAKL